MLHTRGFIAAGLVMILGAGCGGRLGRNDQLGVDGGDAGLPDALGDAGVEADGDAPSDASPHDAGNDADRPLDGDPSWPDADDAADGGPCEYPAGPYGFYALSKGSGPNPTVPPMAWPEAKAGVDQLYEPDFGALFCNPEIKGVFIAVTASWCPNCPDRMRAYAREAEHWERNGVAWVFLVEDVDSAELADVYTNHYGVTFGWRSNDLDNSEGERYVIENNPFRPWTAVVRTSDMKLIHTEDLLPEEGQDRRDLGFETLLELAAELGAE